MGFWVGIGGQGGGGEGGGDIFHIRHSMFETWFFYLQSLGDALK